MRIPIPASSLAAAAALAQQAPAALDKEKLSFFITSAGSRGPDQAREVVRVLLSGYRQSMTVVRRPRGSMILSTMPGIGRWSKTLPQGGRGIAWAQRVKLQMAEGKVRPMEEGFAKRGSPET